MSLTELYIDTAKVWCLKEFLYVYIHILWCLKEFLYAYIHKCFPAKLLSMGIILFIWNTVTQFLTKRLDSNVVMRLIQMPRYMTSPFFDIFSDSGHCSPFPHLRIVWDKVWLGRSLRHLIGMHIKNNFSILFTGNRSY